MDISLVNMRHMGNYIATQLNNNDPKRHTYCDDFDIEDNVCYFYMRGSWPYEFETIDVKLNGKLDIDKRCVEYLICEEQERQRKVTYKKECMKKQQNEIIQQYISYLEKRGYKVSKE